MRIIKVYKNKEFTLEFNKCFGLAVLWDKNTIGIMLGFFVISFERLV